MTRNRPDPHDVLGVPPNATQAEITAAYRHLVRELHPDRRTPDPDRLAAVLAAYRLLRAQPARAPAPEPAPVAEPVPGVPIPVHVHRPRTPDLRAGPVRRHRTTG